MGGCIVLTACWNTRANVSSLYGRVYRKSCVFATKCISFLPVWEGVSWERTITMEQERFPPCMGGCIVQTFFQDIIFYVSSLYGRVYRIFSDRFRFHHSFLPVWEGVSLMALLSFRNVWFPPCMGGCIDTGVAGKTTIVVSSLYGRVYRYTTDMQNALNRFLPVWEGVSGYCLHNPQKCLFPPYMGGCIVKNDVAWLSDWVSSLHERVYRMSNKENSRDSGFLPTWEGVSMDQCNDNSQRSVSSLHGRVYQN